MNILPKDVVNHIYSFSPDHREKMKIIIQEIPQKVVKKKVNTFAFIYKRNALLRNNNYDLHSAYRDASLECVKGEDLRHFCNMLGNCNCCLRHSIRRPWGLSKPVRYRQHNDNTAYKCKCFCRQLLRHICWDQYFHSQNMTNYIY